MKIIFYKAKYGTILDKLIGLFSFSKYSHCELVFSNGICASSSSRDGGMRFKYIDINEHWDIFDLNMDVDEASIRYWFSINDGDSYDWVGAIASLFRIDLSTDDKKFCSEACGYALGVNPIQTPGILYNELKDYGYIK